jgi:hypothetical protein
MTNHILASYIAAYDDQNEITAPPDRMLEVLVIAGVATLRFVPGELGTPAPYESGNPPPSIDVPAKSLLLALQAQIDEEDEDDPPLRGPYG